MPRLKRFEIITQQNIERSYVVEAFNEREALELVEEGHVSASTKDAGDENVVSVYQAEGVKR